MASKYCAHCIQKLLLPSFLADPCDPKSKTLTTCINCRARRWEKKKRKALEPLDPNIPSKRPKIGCTKPTKAPLIPLHIQPETRPESSIRPLPSPESRPQAPLLIPPTPKSPLRPPSQPPLPPIPPPPPVQSNT